ncbi:MAG: sensor domain-containing diguanylate cyclase [Gammaproteobacteria bacterium]|nr:sensor domain-containing diguanylate cyclase [Gammaproteobacteria bacterium]NNC96537.1 sensor domain-containing diguanylate cyclase [Gammaproteobacteria bacterium]NNM13041.1 sensor domain-containing diguanylate cyclase [Gammaproteobacteria bacterium]
MKTPPRPINEISRLETLQSLKILDTPPEERFDRYTRLASSIFDVPIALVSLVDSHRQWFKSSCGLDVSETPRSVSVCGHVINQNDIFVVEDLTKDDRFFDNPLVSNDPKLRFYAGVPLQPLNGYKLGSFCVLDYEPRSFTDKDRKDLLDLASMVSDELVLYVDELTGLTNRRGFNMIAQTVLSAAHRSKNIVSVVMLDMDHFKYINDQFGHIAGDRALKIFADCMTQVFRESDVISRFGGDEFCVLLSNTSKQDAVTGLERLRELLDEANANPQNEFQLAFSAGVVESGMFGAPSIENLMSEADRLLYAEKSPKQKMTQSIL